MSEEFDSSGSAGSPTPDDRGGKETGPDDSRGDGRRTDSAVSDDHDHDSDGHDHEADSHDHEHDTTESTTVDDDVQFSVPDMDCASCANKVGNALEDAEVADYETRPTTGTVLADIGETDGTPDGRRAAVDRIVAAIESAGYEVTGTSLDGEGSGVSGDRSVVWRSPRAIKTAVAALLTVAGIAVGNPLTEARGPTVAADALGTLLAGVVGTPLGVSLGAVAVADL
ncbi:MAG: heavy-metal-associated domain-containing protein, partial [Halobaculum sp.]